ncbi:MAG TPA: hypothetical protein PLE24_10800, partial [Chitinispirillaceae bacterium]|nr:hypothetical protein [Chitinispirillaceae bacterium]
MKKNLIITIISTIIICGCGEDTGTTVSPFSEEEIQKQSNLALIDNIFLYAYLISSKYSQSVPSTITNATVKGEYGTVTFSGSSSEINDSIILFLSSTFNRFNSYISEITECRSSDTVFLDKDTKHLMGYRTNLQNCVIKSVIGLSKFSGSILFNPITVTKQTDTTMTLRAPCQISVSGQLKPARNGHFLKPK